ncbi:AAA family ATPase [Loigolactobacillus backii]|uniref:Endonuclease GajA/Old nuclease/RecF-like AAA domain-containing protein n=1 Tax=Loigolactobacillus backii TaxID=375175 RepID=A0A192H0T2_9LACO|nr:AAA family ATPase [Loigolactobacillus backii]ANK61852.1 hypothetical protein AYR53_03150 [Loigolactobacillus backii]ANK68954.1 hypothetical protein AYR56_01575 [Loigolactobacillus backii]MDA5387480.1 ATP-binding protein [Loigolactobacillus backii]MDA5390034.1 ATP-binding protein [Loigolactobacillus backii]PIO82368.1 hypothetical protein BSQ39_01715 [Loigolactobacillus backii]
MAIIGEFIGEFKSYRSVDYISFINDEASYYSTILGHNGVGKSAILQSLDFFFNSSVSWIRNNQTKSYDSSYVSVLVKLNKIAWEKFIKKNFKAKADELLDATEKVNKIVNDFLDNDIPETSQLTLKKLKQNQPEVGDDEYCLLIGLTNERACTTKPLETAFKSSINGDEMDLLYKAVSLYHTYIYIPTDSGTRSILKLNGENISKTLTESTTTKIIRVLGKEKILSTNMTAIEFINNELDNYVDEINRDLSINDSAYSYAAKNHGKLRTSDLAEQVVMAYFETRQLLKNNATPLLNLSSGEQRQAVIDVMSSLLKKRESKIEKGRFIFAIDEPEMSQDIDNIFRQFEVLENLANISHHQVIVTTHWYGVLPTTKEGSLIYVESDTHGSKTTTIKLQDLFAPRAKKCYQTIFF